MNFQEFYNNLVEQFSTNPWWWTVPIAVLILLFILVRSFRPRGKTIHLFQSSNGRITVSRSALANFIKKITYETVSATLPKVSIRLRRNHLHFNIRLKVYTNQKVSQVSRILQEKISDSLKNNLGIEQIGDINITVTGFINPVNSKTSTVTQPVKESSLTPDDD